jgi:hypothetical protein
MKPATLVKESTVASMLPVKELIPFIPAKDFEASKRFYAERANPPKREAWGKVVYMWGPSGELWHLTETQQYLAATVCV